MRGRCDQVIHLTLGHEFTPRHLSIEGGGDTLLRLPIIAVLAHGPEGWLLIDTGLSETMRDEATARTIYRTRAPEFATAEVNPLLWALSSCGLNPGDLAAVAVSHLHVDHTGGLGHVPAGIPVFIQGAELDFGLSAGDIEHAYVRTDYMEPSIAWERLDGDAPLLSGVEAISTPGHTPGHMSFRVRLSNGATHLYAMDAIDLQDGIDSDTPIGSSALPAGEEARRASHARLMALAAEEHARLLPGHCPVTWPTLPGPPHGLISKELR